MKIPAKEFVRQFSLYGDLANTKPVLITKHGRQRLVLLSIEDYNQLQMRQSAGSAGLGSAKPPKSSSER